MHKKKRAQPRGTAIRGGLLVWLKQAPHPRPNTKNQFNIETTQ